jgi:16S rRNA processing protein RimM
LAGEPTVTLAAVSGAHGICGEVRLKLFSQGLGTLKGQEAVAVGDRLLTLMSVRPGGGGAIARFAEIGDRDAAEALRGQLVTVARAALPPLAEGEYYHADLIGLPCVDHEGEALGTVVAVEDFGAGAILDIERLDRRRAMIPFREGIADLADGRIVADPTFLA